MIREKRGRESNRGNRSSARFRAMAANFLPKAKLSSVCKLCQLTARCVITNLARTETRTIHTVTKPSIPNNGKCFPTSNVLVKRFQSTVAINNLKHGDEDVTKEEQERCINLVEKVKHAMMDDLQYQRIFAVVHLGGRQHKITQNDIIIFNKISAQCGEKIKLQKVLMVGGREFSLIGKPLLSSQEVHIEATVLEKPKGRKLIVFKKKRRKNWKKWRGHRQELTVLRINKIRINPSIL